MPTAKHTNFRLPKVEAPMSARKLCLDVNKTVGLGTIVAIAASLYRATPDLTVSFISTYLFLVFFVFFRFKVFLDDAFFFETKANFRSKRFNIGFTLAIVSWGLMIYAVFCIPTLHTAYLLTLTAIGVSAIWIVAEGSQDRFYRTDYLAVY
jgi:hypothetical protein